MLKWGYLDRTETVRPSPILSWQIAEIGLCDSTAYTAYVKDANPNTLLVIARPESGKTEVLKKTYAGEA